MRNSWQIQLKKKKKKIFDLEKNFIALEHYSDVGTPVFAQYSYCIQQTAEHCSFNLSVLWVLAFLKSNVVLLLLNSDSKHPLCGNVT